ncbi:MAG: SNF2-related protein, partial [Chitinispirillia bacterium]
MQHKAFLAAGNGDEENKDKAFLIGQRWRSEMEPELGIGIIERIEKRYITISFHNGTNKRQYSRVNTPLKRVIFQSGDTIKTKKGLEFTVHEIIEKNGLMYYKSLDREIVETEISDSTHSLSPFKRLLDGNIDSIKDFNFRYNVLLHNAKIKDSPVRGFIGGRIDLIPHQIYIADSVSGFHYRRILLADEVGLGKTIEACLILHRLYLCGHAKRVLIIVPESMVHVWFVELLRKFNLSFRIINNEDISELNDQESEENPFLDDQLFITDIDLLSQNTTLGEKAARAGWDMFIVDEVHRIQTRTKIFQLVDTISRNSGNVIFLSATPEQNGTFDHFSRLKLLDPNRYPDYKKFLNEIEKYKTIADGRTMFRNTRSTIGGFPDRKVHITTLTAPETVIKEINSEFVNDSSFHQHQSTVKYHYFNDPRIQYIINLVKTFRKEKFLLISRTKEKVKEIVRVLKQKVHINIAEFHEELSLIQRDRNAAWFSEEDGARLLLCSEIGSEGR